MNRIKSSFLIIILLIISNVCFSANYILQNESLSISLNEKGFFSSIRVNNVEILRNSNSPIITICTNDKILLPTKIIPNNGKLTVILEDGSQVILQTSIVHNSIALEVIDIAEDAEALLFGPLFLNIHEEVGEIIGVIQEKNFAFGIQALNIKTCAGLPSKYAQKIFQQFGYSGKSTSISTTTILPENMAATQDDYGAILQFFCRNRSREELCKTMNCENALSLPVDGEEGKIVGAKIAFFGCNRAQTLNTIGALEVEYRLPHPMFDGIWGKQNRDCMQSYLITDFNESNLDFTIEKAQKAGFKYIYQMDPFEKWGHFNWNPDFVKGDDEQVAKIVAKAEKAGIHVGIHTLSNFITTNDEYVTPIPSQHLLKQAKLSLIQDISERDTLIRIINNHYFEFPLTLNTLQIGDELITFRQQEVSGNDMILKGCARGAFGTTASHHSKDETLYKLWDYPYKTLFPDIELQDSLADRLGELFNRCQLRQISFDGLEGCSYTGHDEYAISRFVSRCYKNWKNPVINDASRLGHYTWHIHTRMNWGEPWGEEIRVAQVNSRIQNQEFFVRNLFPRMLGWFQIRLKSKKFEATTEEDIEWALSKAAGFDAGYAMTVNMKTLVNHGQMDLLLDDIKNWDYLRRNEAFSDAQREKFRDPLSEWHLEKFNDSHYYLYPVFISKRFQCDVSEMQPGQPGGADWIWKSDYEGRFAMRIFLDGEGHIENPAFKTSAGVLKFNCTLNENEYILFDHSGKASITDKNYNFLRVAEVQGEAKLTTGDNVVSFSFETSDDEVIVVVRYIVRGNPEICNTLQN